jgi:hypothetical protein
MSKPQKHSQAFLHKRRLLTFVPVPGVICLTVLFYLGGGGEGVTAAASPAGPGSSGLNLTLPAAGKTALYADKMEASKAPPDSSHRNGLAFVPSITETTQAASPDSATPGAGGLNYAVQPGQPAARYEANADPNVVAMQTRLQRLQQQTASPATVASATSAPVAATSSRAGASSSPAQDPRLDESLKELSALKNQYQQRLLTLNAPAAQPAAPAAAVKPAKSMTVISRVPRSVVSSLTQTAPQTNGFHTLGASQAAPPLPSTRYPRSFTMTKWWSRAPPSRCACWRRCSSRVG